MRINKYVALATGMSRRAADIAIAQQRVTIDGIVSQNGSDVTEHSMVMLDGSAINVQPRTTLMIHKPAGYVVSRDGQGSPTVYDLLPSEYSNLKPVGRLDKDSSGLLLLTNDGQLAQELTHPKYQKHKVYEITLDTPLQPLHRQMISDHGLQLDDGPSQLQLNRHTEGDDRNWNVTMSEGRNRQIRRTFAALGYNVSRLHRVQFGGYHLHRLPEGHFAQLAANNSKHTSD